MINNIKKLPIIGYVFLAICVIALVLFFYWSFAPYNILSAQNAPIPIQPPTLASGADTTVIASAKLCKQGEPVPIVTRTIVGSGVVIMTPSYNGVLRSQGCHLLRQAIILPDFLPIGTYHIHWRVVYQVNPIRQVIMNYDSQHFQITKKLH